MRSGQSAQNHWNAYETPAGDHGRLPRRVAGVSNPELSSALRPTTHKYLLWNPGPAGRDAGLGARTFPLTPSRQAALRPSLPPAQPDSVVPKVRLDAVEAEMDERKLPPIKWLGDTFLFQEEAMRPT